MGEVEDLEAGAGGQHEAGHGLQSVVVEQEGGEEGQGGDLESAHLVDSIVSQRQPFKNLKFK